MDLFFGVWIYEYVNVDEYQCKAVSCFAKVFWNTRLFFKGFIEMVISTTWWGNCFTSSRSFGLDLALIFPKAIIVRVNLVVFALHCGLWGVFSYRILLWMWEYLCGEFCSFGQRHSALCWRRGERHPLWFILSKAILSLFQVCVSVQTSPPGWPVSTAWTVTTATLWLAHRVIVNLALAQTVPAVPKLQRQDRWSVPTALQDRQVRYLYGITTWSLSLR